MSDLIGQSLGRYHILEQLGEGGMAIVYKAYDTRLESEVAIKFIRMERLTPEMVEKTLKRFEREAKALAKLSHPNIVRVTDYGEYEGRPYLVMPYLSGGTLKQLLKGKPMDWQQSARLLIPIAEALDYAHKNGVLHRDIKSSNILLTDSGAPMLADFGVAKLFEAEETLDLTGTGVGIGTPEYMAPEQGRGKTDQRSEVYSLGIVFYELVTGRKPYTAETPLAVLIMQATDPLQPPRKFVTNLPSSVEGIVFKALAKAPEARYQNMGEFAAALQKVATGKKVKPAWSHVKKSKILAGSAVLVAPLLIFALGFKYISGAVPMNSTTPPATATEPVNISNTATPVSQLITVDAIKPWKDSGIVIHKGDRVRISYVSGQWHGGPGGDYFNGMDCSGAYSDGLLPSASGTSLIAKIGVGDAFCVGNVPEYLSPLDGRLYLSYNDCPTAGCFSDNSGSLVVSVVVISSQNSDATMPTPTGRLLFTNDFERGDLRDFRIKSGVWEIIPYNGNDVLRVTEDQAASWPSIEFGPENFSNGTIQYRFNVTDLHRTNSQSGMVYSSFRANGEGISDGYTFQIQLENTLADMNYVPHNGDGWPSLGNRSVNVLPNQWHTVRIELVDWSFKVFLDQKLLLTAVDDKQRLSVGRLGFQGSPQTTILFDDVQVWTGE